MRGHRRLLGVKTKYFTASRSEQVWWVEDSRPEDELWQSYCTLVLRFIKSTGNSGPRTN